MKVWVDEGDVKSNIKCKTRPIGRLADIATMTTQVLIQLTVAWTGVEVSCWFSFTFCYYLNQYCTNLKLPEKIEH